MGSIFKTREFIFLMLGNKIWGQQKRGFSEKHYVCRILSLLLKIVIVGVGDLVVPRNKIGKLGEGASLEVV